MEQLYITGTVADFLALHVTESELNVCIKNTQDLSVLQTALELKFSLLRENKHLPINFPIACILDQLNAMNIDEICHILRLAIMVQNNESQYLVLLEYINEHLNNCSEDCSLLTYLKLFNLALCLCESKKRQDTWKTFVAPYSFGGVINKLIVIDNKAITNYLSVYILPKYLSTNIPGVANVLKKIWINALDSKYLDILCAMPEYFLPCEPAGIHTYPLVNVDKFWFFLQECLESSNSQNQKQALYLLKQALYSLKDTETFETGSKVVFWNLHTKADVSSAFQNLCTLFEISREKQLHLVEPAYQLLTSTVKMLHSSWLICIYKILLAHPHSVVSAYAAVEILKSEWHENTDIFKIVINNLLPAVNKTECAQKIEIWNNFNLLCKRLSSQNFLVLLQESASISWVPAVCYLFYRSVFTHYQPVSFNLIENIVNNIENIPHKFIRVSCTEFIASSINQAYISCKVFGFGEYVTISYILFKDKYSPLKLPSINVIEYLPDVKEIIKTWRSAKYVDLKQITIIMKIIELPLLENDWVEENIHKPFVARDFAPEISDRLCVILFLRDWKASVFEYIHNRLENLKSEDKTALKEVVPLLFIGNYDERELTHLFNKCAEIILCRKSNLVQIDVAFEVITVFMKNCKHCVSFSNIDNELSVWKDEFVKSSKKIKTCSNLVLLKLYCNRELCENTVHSKIDTQNFTPEKLMEVITIFENIFETENNIVIPYICTQLQYLLQLGRETDTVFNFVDICLKRVTELKRTDLFKSSVENFITSLFHNSKLHNNHEDVVIKTVSVTGMLLELAKCSDDVAYSLATGLYYLSTFNNKPVVSFVPIIVELLMYGDVLNKSQRAEYLVCQMIRGDEGRTGDDNPNVRKVSVRGYAVIIMQSILNDDCFTEEEKSEVADAVTLLLMNNYHVNFNKRYFANSQIHLEKLRILQALLVVHNNIKTQKQPLIDLLMNSICSESHQVSIKFLVLWLLIRLLCDNDHCLSVVSSKMESTSKLHSSTIIAFVPILYHIALWKNDESFFLNLLAIMLPWTMGAHFNLRLYAQEGIKKLYQVACERGFTNVREKYKASVICIADVLEKTERKIDSVDRYLLDVFNAKDHYHIQTIYFDVPNITNVTCDEYENVLSIQEFNASKKLQEIHNTTIRLRSIHESQKSLKQNCCATVIQKKITPWIKLADDDITPRKIGELVVVASLIDKAPNLGGLSRTCEIFGVKQLVLSSINTVKDHEFQSVSMSSENWVDILEIKEDQLRSYLLQMKEKGYCIIGAEQTSDSTLLNTFRFPKMCVLLLGNEKEGVPPHLLSLIDTCVEIPQFGVVRSLNVHVAAATFVWEYTKQHML